MASIAKITAVGNLGGDPETRYTPSGKQNLTFSMAVSRRKPDGSENTTWLRVTAWGKLAEVLGNLTQQGALVKGAQVFVAGTFEAREYESNGVTRMSLDVNADEVQLVGSRGDRPAQSQESLYEPVPF